MRQASLPAGRQSVTYPSNRAHCRATALIEIRDQRVTATLKTPTGIYRKTDTDVKYRHRPWLLL